MCVCVCVCVVLVRCLCWMSKSSESWKVVCVCESEHTDFFVECPPVTRVNCNGFSLERKLHLNENSERI